MLAGALAGVVAAAFVLLGASAAVSFVLGFRLGAK